MPDNVDWLVLTDDRGNRRLAFQQVDNLKRATWPLSVEGSPAWRRSVAVSAGSQTGPGSI